MLITCLLGVLGCGNDDNLDPISDLILRGVDPSSVQVDVNPPQTRTLNFIFEVALSDPSLSVIQRDAWTVNRYEFDFYLESDPGSHLIQLPESRGGKVGTMVQPGTTGRTNIILVDSEWVSDNAAGFTGTSDEATVRLRAKFWARRHVDNARKILTMDFLFTFGDY